MMVQDLDRRRVEQESVGETALLLRNAIEAFELFRIHERQVKASLAAVIEEDGLEDLSRSRWQPEGDIRDAEDCFDLRDLLLDEAD